MKKYKVLKPYLHNTGKIWLSDVQAAPRKHMLTAVAPGCYLPKGELCFKAGEVIGLDAVIGKALASTLVVVEAKKP
jgi:hypothetical protein